jgi:hypothetical protein
VYDVEMAAKTITDLIEHPQREVIVGSAGRVLTGLHTVVPGAAEQLYAKQVDKGHLSTDQAVPPTRGNLFEPMQEGTSASGGWKETKKS